MKERFKPMKTEYLWLTLLLSAGLIVYDPPQVPEDEPFPEEPPVVITSTPLDLRPMDYTAENIALCRSFGGTIVVVGEEVNCALKPEVKP